MKFNISLEIIAHLPHHDPFYSFMLIDMLANPRILFSLDLGARPKEVTFLALITRVDARKHLGGWSWENKMCHILYKNSQIGPCLMLANENTCT